MISPSRHVPSPNHALRGAFALIVLIALLWGMSALAAPLQNFNVLDVGSPPPAKALERKALQQKSLSSQGLKVETMHIEERLDAPHLITFAATGAKSASLKKLGVSAEGAARYHLKNAAYLYGVTDQDVDRLALDHVEDMIGGAVLAKFSHAVDGVDVFRESVTVLMNSDYVPQAIRGVVGRDRLIGGAPATLVMSKSAGKSSVNVFALSPQQAIARALEDYGVGDAVAESLTQWASPTQQFAAGAKAATAAGEYRYYWQVVGPVQEKSAAAFMSEPARVKPVWFRTATGLVPAYYIELQMHTAMPGAESYYSHVIAADDGRLLFRNNLSSNAAFTYRVYAERDGINLPLPSPAGRNGTPHPTATNNGFQGSFVPQNDITLQNGPISTNDPWLPDGATQTVGNNVEAWANLSRPTSATVADVYEPSSDVCNLASTQPGDYRACTSAPNAFLYTFDPTRTAKTSKTQIVASVVNLFYMNNWLHDWYYDAGFKEVNGNAQASNYGRGGRENDSIRAHAQDLSGVNNANMATPADGARPRMRMYIFTGSSNAAVTVPTMSPAFVSRTVGAVFGPTSFSVEGPMAVADDGAIPTADGCEPLLNQVTGMIVIIERGGPCSFKAKVRNAQLAGARGVIIANNLTGASFSMVEDDTVPGPITIPSLMVTRDEGDRLRVAINNAGETPLVGRVQRAVGVDRDGTMDNMIIAHEWGHYISNRLIGDANGLNSNQSRGLGEGWADFHGLLMAVKAEDAQAAANAGYNGVYTVGSYALDGPQIAGVTQSTAFYYGIRRYPYSNDLTKNPFTFRHIQTGVALPTNPPPAFTGDNAQVHNTGSVWASMLWSCYGALLRDTGRLTFAQAQERMKRYLVAAYKLTPNDPTLVEARDAVFAAMRASDPADLALCQQGFAQRGAGIFARSGPRGTNTNAGVIESFLVSTPANYAGNLQFTQSAQSASEGASVTLTVTRTDGSTGAASVNYTAVDGTASVGVDFPLTFGTLNWAAGDASPKTITIPILSDDIAESPKAFTVALSDAVGAFLSSPNVQTITVVDAGTFPENCAIPNGWYTPTGATAGWAVATDSAWTGACSLKSRPIPDGGSTLADVTRAQIAVRGTFNAGTVTFARRVSSESGYDCLRFTINGVQQSISGSCSGVGGTGASGEVAWGLVNVPITAGTHTLVWSYEKDEFTVAGQDAAWIDALTMPLVAVIPPGPTDYSDMWWAGQAENGWGMSIQQHSNGVQFNALYVYDAAGQPRWYVMPGGTWNSNFTSYTGAVYQPTSAPLNNYTNATFVPGASPGSVTLNFLTPSTATLNYTINGVTGSKSIQRQSFSAGTAPFNVADLWWAGGNQDGWGINLAQQGGTIFAVWYTYGLDGKAYWLVMPGGSWSGNTYSGTLFATTGSPWLGATYNPAQLAVTQVGTISLAFSSAMAATMNYSFTAGPFAGTTQSKTLVRQPF